MRLFQRKGNDLIRQPADLIPCDTFISDPPLRYTKPHRQPELDNEQQVIYHAVLQHFSDPQLRLPVNGHAEDLQDSNNYSTLGDWEKFWLSRECILRYLRATAWNAEQTIRRLHNTLLWRRQFGLADYANLKETATSVANENDTGKISLLGYDRKSQLVLILKNGRQNTDPSFEQIRQIVWFLEAASILAPKGTECWTLIIDLKNHHIDNGGTRSLYEYPPLSLAKQVINIFQDHYPERLYKCLICNVPNSAWTFLKLVYPLIEPEPRKKILYNDPLEIHIESDQLGAEYGGRLDFNYDNSIYWPDLIQTVESRKKVQYEKFEALGANVGIREFEIKRNT
ncbi:phosphatidylinositol transporter [Kluyveromyces lactis]|uniref:KLLA0C02519p n=1 Tax=Kluyveromyces lactis (strain ATCC 8585 / CBS 2359 / DSM 70799 / NBRC 1267 / NRRL Y-1140 / WM37) TaxID=284590 RepID=Q6CUT0_KLULA|nr:uncharacterized protein KLLA0_C02519g [Kluyveromyces lactis]CAH01160.1 KLLA0C02519p [Kluyveromyces lactis]|eukprot:XP_452309.1 uncharacterized protein KLLA0_C02519g [Kluyveromyces lactis]